MRVVLHVAAFRRRAAETVSEAPDALGSRGSLRALAPFGRLRAYFARRRRAVGPFQSHPNRFSSVLIA
jgi:hypothetical protein